MLNNIVEILPRYYSEFYFENEILTKIGDDINKLFFKRVYYKHSKKHKFYRLDIGKNKLASNVVFYLKNSGFLNKLRKYIYTKIVFDVITGSPVYRYKIPLLEMGGVRFYSGNIYGKKNSIRKKFDEAIPRNAVIPSVVHRKKMLLIPKEIVKKLKINESIDWNNNKSKDEWLVGTYLLKNDNIFIFKVHRESKGLPLLKCLNPVIFEDELDYELCNVSLRDIYIWQRPIRIYQKKGNYYFNVPDLLLNPAEEDYRYLSKKIKKPHLPAFEISFDDCENFIYSKVFYSDVTQRDSVIISKLYSN